MQGKKVIIDTNIWISYLITNNYSFLDRFIENGKIILIFSNELYGEFLEVIERPKFKKYFKKSEVIKLTNLIGKFGKQIEVSSNVEMCRNKKDDFLLNLAIESNADYLIIGDLDLLDIKQIINTKIIKIKEFEEILSN